MVMKLKKTIFPAIFLLSLAAPQAQASSAACSRLAGSTIFTDMLYGVAAGALLSGLYMAADDDFERSNNKVAYGALAGSAVGIGVGLAEVFTAKCLPQADAGAATRTESARLSLFAAPSRTSPVAGLNFSLAI